MAATELAERRKPGGMETAITESHGSEERRAEGNGDGEVKMSEPRAVVRTLTCERKTYVEGFALWRSIGSSIVSCCWPELPELDPILSLDEFEFSAPAAFPDHPHRGFENVTYMLEGGVSYHDFSGHKGIINAGDVQWLTAGRGVVHAEVPAGNGVQRGINIWVNLSASDKMVEPRYQDLASNGIPTAATGDGGVSVKVIAGECLGARSPHGEAVVRDGPFVMNTREEVEQAREDFRRRRNGFEMADGWTSDHAATAAEH